MGEVHRRLVADGSSEQMDAADVRWLLAIVKRVDVRPTRSGVRVAVAAPDRLATSVEAPSAWDALVEIARRWRR